MHLVRLDRFDNGWYQPGRSMAISAAWFWFGLPLVRSSWIPFSSVRVWLLRAFGATIGSGVVVKPGVRVKYPCVRLAIGVHAWVGERGVRMGGGASGGLSGGSDSGRGDYYSWRSCDAISAALRNSRR